MPSYVASLADPAGSSSILAAVQWLEGTVLGTIATTVAVIAVAGIGFMALSGRVDLRRAFAAVVGCFVLFGASSIVAGVQSVADREGSMMPVAPILGQSELSPVTPLAKPASTYDPYAGAAVPQTR